ncbi:MAG: T9SS type A sorting domain-containing protein [Bacteroidia bacterium]
MKFLLTVLFGFLTGYLAFAQIQVDRQVIGNAGGYASVDNMLIASTVGEAVTATAISGTFSYAQGFQQPDGSGSVGIDDEPDLHARYSFFPNPTDQFLYISLTTTRPAQLTMEIFDITGRLTPVNIPPLLINGTLDTRADLSSLADGTYQLVLKNTSGQAVHSVKIRKIH